MKQHTLQIFARMLTFLKDYQQGMRSLRGVVDSLEGSLNALEERLPDSFYTEWYAHWGDLEQIAAMGTEHKHREVVLEKVKALESLLSQYVES